ncbi:MAG TPA: diacylglycerol kinase [Burkholderiaceae bacterium]
MRQDDPPEKDAPRESSAFKSRPGLERLVNATRYSMAGLAAAWRDESAFRQELALCAVLLPLGLWLGDTGVERALLVAPLVLVLVVELLNSAIEAVVDLASPRHHALAARAKDLGSAAVFASLVLVAAVWGLVLL